MAEGYGSDLLAVAWEGPEIPRGVITNQYLRLPVDTIKPKPIFNFNWLKTSEDTVILQWNATTDNVDVKRYLISESNKLLATTSKDKLSIELTGLESATRYDFTIRAQDKAGNKSMESDPLMIVIDDFIAPSVVTNIRVNEKGTNFIDLGWDASTDEDKQQILYRIYQDGELAAQTYNTNYRLKQLLPATNYNLTLEAVDIVGNSSGLSNGLSIQTNALVADTPVFEYPYYEFSVPANGSIGSSFATLSFNEQQGLAFKVVGGDDAD
ncbi:Glycoside hydrolase family 10 [Moritella viscosa]|nr:Glycoside hydrolase family 10 [Moritella viscosa]